MSEPMPSGAEVVTVLNEQACAAQFDRAFAFDRPFFEPFALERRRAEVESSHPVHTCAVLFTLADVVHTREGTVDQWQPLQELENRNQIAAYERGEAAEQGPALAEAIRIFRAWQAEQAQQPGGSVE